MPHIASFVTQKQPKTMLELFEAARIAELTAPPTFESDTSVAKTLANVEQQLKLMRAEWDGHTASAAGVAPCSSTCREPKKRTNSTPQSITEKCALGETQQWEFTPQPPPPTRGYPRRGDQGRGRGRSGRFSGFGSRRGYSPQYQQPGFAQVQQYGMPTYSMSQPQHMQQNLVQPSFQRPQFQQQYQPTQYQSGQQTRPVRIQCPKCGRKPHDPIVCPAYNQSCRFCGCSGHFERVCRAAARAAQGTDQQ